MVKNGQNDFTLLVASAQTHPSVVHDIEGKTKLEVKYGDFSADLSKVVEALKEVSVLHGNPRLGLCGISQAKKYTANDIQSNMIESYIKSSVTTSVLFSHSLWSNVTKRFETGSIKDHKDGSRWWVKDVGPVVESYIGVCLYSTRVRVKTPRRSLVH